MFETRVLFDYSVFENRMERGLLGRVIPYAKIQVRELARAAQILVMRYTPLPRGGGRTKIRDLWETEYSRKGQQDIYTIKNLYPNQDVILFLEEGTRPHLIFPRKSKVLHWVTDAGADAFSRYVVHPGTRAWHMIATAEARIQPKVDQFIQMTFDMLGREVG